MDDKKGRREAKRLGLIVVGTLAVLKEAADRRLLDLVDTIDRLEKDTSFRMSAGLRKTLIEWYGKNRP